MPASKLTRIERFMAKVEMITESGCWIWLGSVTRGGYGLFQADRLMGAHRFAYEHFIGTIPTGLQIDHLCRVRCCVNPAHLEAVTGKVNTNRGRRWESEKTHCPQGHPYDESNTKRWKNNRYCRECSNAILRKNWRKYKANWLRNKATKSQA